MENKTIRYKNGLYVGQTQDGKRHGQGTYTWDNGTVYEGEFAEGKRHGLILKKHIDSPIKGGDGNREYLALWTKE